MQNESMGIKDIPYSADSLKRIQLYIPTATVTVRVPAAKLDSVVSMLTSMSTFIESRIMKDEDKTLSYLSNALKNDGPPPVAIQPSKQATTVSVATYQDKKYDAETNRRIANMAILDDVHYATFTVQLYQPQMADQQIIVNPEKVILAGFGTEVLQSLRTGLESFSKLVIILVACWPYLLLLTIGMLIYRKVWRKKVPTPINQL
ncbi:DUF4349 domain-containing protein [Chitinophaga rhizophila]|uniref:DUF4349 domain-containing protein n=1 Tax=Chitinophaga rhizophila TaxID=2866212 RepID=A0ABS7G9C1_9BACT|nr:DUF4349 domain-containing protein [Chitinophaga rhizophila]MBW8683384.1 DUF4349 domain-containing protein [Chitinophaga rhizophila]